MKHDSNGHVLPSSQEVAALLSRYRASGLGLARFAREAGIPYGRLHYWLYQKPRAGGPRRWAQGKDLVAAPVFQEVKLAGGLLPTSDWAVEKVAGKRRSMRFIETVGNQPATSCIVVTEDEPCSHTVYVVRPGFARRCHRWPNPPQHAVPASPAIWLRDCSGFSPQDNPHWQSTWTPMTGNLN